METKHLYKLSLLGACAFIIAMPLAMFVPIAVLHWKGPALAVALAIIFLALATAASLPLILLLKNARDVFGGSIANQLIFAAAGLVFYLALAFTANVLEQLSFPFSLAFALLAFLCMAWISVGGWLIILHTVGFVLSVGRRLPRANRLMLYHATAAVPTTAVLLLLRHKDLLTTDAFLLVGIIFGLVLWLGFKDFAAFPAVARDSKYDPLASRCAAWLGGK